MFNTNTWRGQIVDLATTKTLSEILRHFILKLVFTNTAQSFKYNMDVKQTYKINIEKASNNESFPM